MKLKYYLRGLGIGIVVTAFVFMITSGKKEALSDAEIRERAAKLGMVDASSMTLSTLVNAGQQTDATSPEGENQPAETEAESKPSEKETNSMEKETNSTEKETSSTEKETNSTESENTPTVPETTPSEAETKPIPTITIGKGADSYSVSKDLEAAGLIENAREYDAYLCENGYSKRISIGTYEIPIGTSQEEIAKIITGKR